MMDKFRMAQWLLIAAAFHYAALNVADPQIQTICMKLGHVTIAAWFGYVIDRTAFRKRITQASTDLECIRRAIIIGSAMLSIGLGL